MRAENLEHGLLEKHQNSFYSVKKFPVKWKGHCILKGK